MMEIMTDTDLRAREIAAGLSADHASTLCGLVAEVAWYDTLPHESRDLNALVDAGLARFVDDDGDGFYEPTDLGRAVAAVLAEGGAPRG